MSKVGKESRREMKKFAAERRELQQVANKTLFRETSLFKEAFSETSFRGNPFF